MTKCIQNLKKKIKSLGDNMTKYGEKNTVLEVISETAHYKRGFWGASLWPRHIESTCRQRHPIDASTLGFI